MAQTSGEVLFTDEDFAWVDAPVERAPAQPASPPRPTPRRQTRTFAHDLARLRAALLGGTAALSPRARALVAVLAVAGLLAVALVVAFGGGEGEKATRPAARPSIATPTSAPPNAQPSFKLLRRGDRTPAVADLQHALVALGLYSQPVDGVFGDSTGAAVLAFQHNRGLVVDGVAGPTTVQALVAALSESAKVDADTAEQGLAAAVAADRLSPRSAERYRSIVARALTRFDTLAPGRVGTLALVLHDVAGHAGDYDEPRALVLFGMLDANARHLAKHATPVAGADIRDPDGVVYRFFPAHGFQFHPLANFGRLNALAGRRRTEPTRRLAAALVARAVPSGKTLTWEYYFPFGGPSRWSSGFVQAVAAQALARSASSLEDPELSAAAKAAYRAIPQGLSRELGGGLWVREYSFSDIAILNAQLQSLFSLQDYVASTRDARARAITERLDRASRSLLTQFDTGCWSRYSLDGAPATLDYHKYHVSLLRKLGRQTHQPIWSETARRWNAYLRSSSPTAC